MSAKPNLWNRFWNEFAVGLNMSESASFYGSVAGTALIAGGYALASLLLKDSRSQTNNAPSKRLLVGAASAAVVANIFLTTFIGSGSALGSNGRRDRVVEMWMRRLDRYVYEGEAGPQTPHATSGTFLTPLAVVTGTSSGLGRYSTENLLACGWKVVAANLEDAEAADLGAIKGAQAILRRRYASAKGAARVRADQIVEMIANNVISARLNVGDPESIKSFVAVLKKIEAERNTCPAAPTEGSSSLATFHDGLRLLLNNAGIYKLGWNTYSPAVKIESMLNVNLAGPTFLTYLTLEQIVKPRLAEERRRAGAAVLTPFRIVNLASVAHSWIFRYLHYSTRAEVLSHLETLLAASVDETMLQRNVNDCKKLVEQICDESYGLSKLGMIALAKAIAEDVRGGEESKKDDSEEAKAEKKKGDTEGERQHIAGDLTALGANGAITAYSLHPGGVRTQIAQKTKYATFLNITTLPFWKSSRNGASNQTYLSLMLLSENKTTDVLTASILAANTKKSSSTLTEGRLNSQIVSAQETSGMYLVDTGEGKGRMVCSCVADDVFAVYRKWFVSVIIPRYSRATSSK